MQRYVSWLIVLLFLATGCNYHIVKANNNNYPIFIDNDEFKAVQALIKTYRAPRAAVTQQQRNDLQLRLMTISDAHYATLRDRLDRNRNDLSFAAEVTATTLSAVSALVGDVDTKSILSTASTLTQSTKTSIDKNIFQQQSTVAIVSTMDAARATQHTKILGHVGDAIADYGLEQSLNDALAYDNAGTVQSALIVLAGNAADTKNKAEKTLLDLR